MLAMLNHEAREVIWPRFVKLYPKLRANTCPVIVLNNRFTKTAGRNWPTENKVEMGTKFLPKHMREIFIITLPHEIAHQVDYNLHGLPAGNRWHGPKWQQIMVKYGLPPEPYHTMEI